MEQNWWMRSYREGDEEKILELWKAVYAEKQFDREQWLSWWRWLYRDNPAGAGLIWLAEHNGLIVGQYAVTPVIMEIEGKPVLGAQSLDTMTHPAYRRQKMFERLARIVYREAREKGISIIYGFPNKFSYPGFIKKLNWFSISSLTTMIKPLNWKKALKLKISKGFLLKLGTFGGRIVEHTLYRTKKGLPMRDLSINQVLTFDGRFNDLLATASKQHSIMVGRNKDYLNWRYTVVPDADYLIYVAERAQEICGYIVFRYIRRGDITIGRIYDIFVLSEQIAHLLISKAIECCRREEIDLVYSKIIANKAYHRAFKKAGFICLPHFKCGPPFCGYLNSPDISKDFFRDRKNWLTQIGDSDGI